MNRIPSTGLALVLASSLAACAADDHLEPGAADSRAVSTETPLVAQLDEATQIISVWPGVDVPWIDLHLTVNGERATHVRMRKEGGGRFAVGPIALRTDDVVTTSFTYVAGGVGHDSATFTRVVPVTFEPRALRPEVRAVITPGAYEIRLATGADAAGSIAWADVHYTVNGGGLMNARLYDRGRGLGHVVSLGAGDVVEYWITYAAGEHVLETGTYRFVPTAPTRTTPWFVGFPAPGADPRQTPRDCGIDGGRFECKPYAGSRIATSGGYAVVDQGGLVPTRVVGIGPIGDYLLRTIQLGFHHAGAPPRSGRAVVQLPTSAVRPGEPPIDDADRERGKFVAADAVLSMGYLLGGEGLTIALVDVNGRRSQALDVVPYRSTYCRYGCSLQMPVAALAADSEVDLTQIRYVEIATQPGATVDQRLVVGSIVFVPPAP